MVDLDEYAKQMESSCNQGVKYFKKILRGFWIFLLSLLVIFYFFSIF